MLGNGQRVSHDPPALIPLTCSAANPDRSDRSDGGYAHESFDRRPLRGPDGEPCHTRRLEGNFDRHVRAQVAVLRVAPIGEELEVTVFVVDHDDHNIAVG